mmetsp:Transcript_13006/g.52400  ORF Transcript_13006/g.52400 Transcript_13006/m.52400 type:complete len:218 (-) Transcript_13006:1123-1776(-)
MDLHAVSCACLLLVSCRTSRMGLRKLAPMESGPVATVLSMRGGSLHVNSASEPMVSTHASDTLLSGSLNLRQTEDTIRGRCTSAFSPCKAHTRSNRRKISRLALALGAATSSSQRHNTIVVTWSGSCAFVASRSSSFTATRWVSLSPSRVNACSVLFLRIASSRGMLEGAFARLSGPSSTPMCRHASEYWTAPLRRPPRCANLPGSSRGAASVDGNV